MFLKHDKAKHNIKSLTLDDFLREEDYYTDNSLHSYPLLYNSVPTLYRCVDIRAKTISAIPIIYQWRGKEYNPNDEVPQPIREFHKNLKDYLFYIEASLCLSGSAYLLRNTNEYGFNPLPISIPPNSITPYYSTNAFAPDYYIFNAYNITTNIEHKDIIAIWYPNIVDTRYPGISPVQVALASSDAMYNMDTFTTNFFKRGAIKATLLTVGSDNVLDKPTREQLSQLEQWWSKLVSGVKSAWNTAVTSANVNPMSVGDGLKDMEYGTISEQKREEITIAMGVPLSLLIPSSANYATAKEERLSFYENTIIPEATFIAEELNRTFFYEYGIELSFQFNKLEVLQEKEVDKAANVQKLVYGGIITINEAREMMGYPIEDCYNTVDTDNLVSIEREQVEVEDEVISLPHISEETIKRLGGNNGY